MKMAPLAPHLRASATGFAGRFALIAAGLIAVIAHGLLRDPRLARHIVPVCRRLSHAAARCTALMAGIAAGRLPRRGAQRNDADRHGAKPHGDESGPDTAGGAKTPRNRPVALLPTEHAWLLKALRHQAAVYRYRLETLLAEPGIAEILAAAPTTARFLRPICRMLGLPFTAPLKTEPPILNPAPTPIAATAAPARPDPPPSPDEKPWRPDLSWINGPLKKTG